jgi:hypothetical protein
MEQRLFNKLKEVTAKKRRRPVEDIHRSLDIVEHILHEANDLGITTNVVTWALKYMKENPKLDISDAIVMGYEEWFK